MTTNDDQQSGPSRDDETQQLDVREDQPPRRRVGELLDDDTRDSAAVEDPVAAAPGRTTAVADPPAAPKGPHVPAIVLGMVCVAVAGLVLAQELGDLTLDWGDIGPLGIALTGGVLVLFGLLGLATSRRKQS